MTEESVTEQLRGFPELKNLRSHRSVRRFTGEPVTDEQLEAILTTAQRASTSSNLQSYSVIVVRDPEKKKTLAALCGGQRQIEDCSVFLAHCADLNRGRMLCEAAGYEFDGRFMEHFLLGVIDASIFAQNALAAAEAIGLGGCMIGGARNKPHEIARLLELPKRVFVVFGMTLGHPMWEKIPPHRPRLPLTAVMHRERYDDSGWAKEHAAYDKTMDQTGIYRKRRIDLSGRVPGWKDTVPEGEYSWSEHSARRWIDPAAQRRALRALLDEQLFGFE
jgi:FMN reductase (NADPH)